MRQRNIPFVGVEVTGLILKKSETPHVVSYTHRRTATGRENQSSPPCRPDSPCDWRQWAAAQTEEDGHARSQQRPRGRLGRWRGGNGDKARSV